MCSQRFSRIQLCCMHAHWVVSWNMFVQIQFLCSVRVRKPTRTTWAGDHAPPVGLTLDRVSDQIRRVGHVQLVQHKDLRTSCLTLDAVIVNVSAWFHRRHKYFPVWRQENALSGQHVRQEHLIGGFVSLTTVTVGKSIVTVRQLDGKVCPSAPHSI